MLPSLSTRRSRVVAGATAGILALGTSLLVSTPATGAPPVKCDPRANNTVAGLLNCVTVSRVRTHQQALQRIADRNGGTRASGSPGYTASANYVAQQAAAAGLTVSRQQFDFPFYQLIGTPVFQRTSAPADDFTFGTEFQDMTYSGAGDVSGTAVPVDLLLPSTGGSTSGCEDADFAGFPANSVALIQRGTCTFGEKAVNAEEAGAIGVIIFNEGNAPDRTGLISGTLGGPVGIPVVDTTFAIGSTLQNVQVRIKVDSVSETRTTENVIAEIVGSKPSSEIVMLGAHLDSVPEGPGIQDNGSGSAANLEVARQMATSKPVHTVRFAWWGAEEAGLLGSQFYVDSLSPTQVNRIALYLNFDMIGSPNFARFIYDGNASTFPESPTFPIPKGSGQIERVFERFYTERGLAFEGTEFDGRSDYEAFGLAGVPSGGLFTGAEDLKSAQQAALYGGRAGQPFDPCYHQACDTFSNINLTVLDQNADAIAYATFQFSSDTEKVSPRPLKEATANPRVAGHLTDSKN